MFENFSFNVMRVKCYFTLVGPSGYAYTNWPTRGTELSAYLDPYTAQSSVDHGMYVHWVGLERNRIAAEAPRAPYVLTLTKPLIGRRSE
jgi:hypothetical protein